MWWLALIGCSSDTVEPELFNAAEQDLVVRVQPSCTDEQLTAVQLTLRSNVGEIPVGTAQVSPGCGPVGTEHAMLVEVMDDFQDLVDDAQVIAIPEAVSDLDGDGDDEARDEATYTLDRDNADNGVFALTLESLGAPDEVREDRWRVELLQFPEEMTEN